ncbi:MAG: sigma 54-interacting transcriptional regulator [Deltaproteobacteria bacterium]|nr:sigma 54-interacting transcriptional regulator [Deltaproteobacteria bacterium]MBW2052444.1 sigma 54-interacting transcriptional regulator [Deltaproteobacteria bacterium]MBW2140438.1 sigma 54-interacting transcriptional regulator [Deltaproteobacteria bacterium]MBW2322960.1 sigma 54-interacting transcriptional regulator [Deltaproteobacteria bacterium]
MDHILIVDDDLSMREVLELMLNREGYEVSLASNGQKALDLVAKKSIDLIISDIRMKYMDGIDILKKVKAIKPETIVILISAFATAETAVIAMNEGAFDFFPKPFQVEELKEVIKRALAHRTLEAEQQKLKENIAEGCHFGSLVGQSPQMLKVYELIRRAAQTPTNILITGESGTGKELVARAIHENAPTRAKEKFVTINCGGMPEELIESELFGHKKGAFTGALMDKPGLFEIANNGTIFLDEIGDLSMPMQVKLLRVVQEKTYRAVGGTEERKVDVRLISATNKDLENEVMNERFREDLYYRLNVINIKMPPLREREGDLPLLAHYFLEKYSRELGKKVWKISSYALDILSQYDFPGNVRELQNIIQRSVALEQSNIILPESLTLGSFKRQPAKTQKKESPHIASETSWGGNYLNKDRPIGLEDTLAKLEIRLLLQALHTAGGIRQTAADLLGTSPKSLRRRLVKYRLEELTLHQIGDRCLQEESEAADQPPGPLNPVWTPEGLNLDMTLQQAEKPLIDQALQKSGGSKTKAAEILGISLSSLTYRLSKNGC